MRKGLREGNIGSEVSVDQSQKENDGNQETSVADSQGPAKAKDIIFYTCEHCGKNNLRSKSGYTLHVKQCVPIKPQLTNDGLYCLVGYTPQEHQRDDIFQLILNKFFDENSNLFLAVKEYFVTSGEAIAKIERLEKDAWQLAGDTRKLARLLREARADAKYLETGFDNNGYLLLRRKNPRKKKAPDEVEIDKIV